MAPAAVTSADEVINRPWVNPQEVPCRRGLQTQSGRERCTGKADVFYLYTLSYGLSATPLKTTGTPSLASATCFPRARTQTKPVCRTDLACLDTFDNAASNLWNWVLPCTGTPPGGSGVTALRTCVQSTGRRHVHVLVSLALLT